MAWHTHTQVYFLFTYQFNVNARDWLHIFHTGLSRWAKKRRRNMEKAHLLLNQLAPVVPPITSALQAWASHSVLPGKRLNRWGSAPQWHLYRKEGECAHLWLPLPWSFHSTWNGNQTRVQPRFFWNHSTECGLESGLCTQPTWILILVVMLCRFLTLGESCLTIQRLDLLFGKIWE